MSDRYVACPLCAAPLVLRDGNITCPRCVRTFTLPVEPPDATLDALFAEAQALIDGLGVRDICQVCGLPIGIGHPLLHLGLCDTCRAHKPS